MGRGRGQREGKERGRETGRGGGWGTGRGVWFRRFVCLLVCAFWFVWYLHLPSSIAVIFLFHIFECCIGHFFSFSSSPLPFNVTFEYNRISYKGLHFSFHIIRKLRMTFAKYSQFKFHTKGLLFITFPERPKPIKTKITLSCNCWKHCRAYAFCSRDAVPSREAEPKSLSARVWERVLRSLFFYISFAFVTGESISFCECQGCHIRYRSVVGVRDVFVGIRFAITVIIGDREP